jgi:23S rRNA pseudouridine1911/1915/1917 synthase
MSILKDITILYEDDDCVVINKPAGLIVHPDGKREEESVVDWVLKKYPKIKDVGEPTTLSSGKVIYRPGIVHRLDRETSGVLLIAKNQESYLFFKNQFKEKDIAKKYHVFVYGNVKLDRGSIDRPIGKSRSNFRQWSAQRGARGEMREAVTDFTVLKRNKEVTFLEARPKTGRTHQIRVHFKAINHPVVCDTLYAPNHKELYGLKRLALHAYDIEFKTLDGDTKKITAPYPKDFTQAVSGFEKTL